jgi:hypothetical protein
VSKVAATQAPLLACTWRTTGELNGPSVSGSGKPCGLPARLTPLAFILTIPLVIDAVRTPWGVPSGSLYLSSVAKDPVQHGFERHTPSAGATASTMRRADRRHEGPFSRKVTERSYPTHLGAPKECPQGQAAERDPAAPGRAAGRLRSRGRRAAAGKARGLRSCLRRVPDRTRIHRQVEAGHRLRRFPLRPSARDPVVPPRAP